MLSGHVFLVGVSGSGKTTLGRRVAAELGIPFADTDDMVGQMMNMTPAQVIKELGSSFFHNAETGVLMEMLGVVPSIVSTGVRVPLLKENVQLMINQGVIVHIDRPLDQVIAEARSGSEAMARLDPDDIINEYNHTIGFYRACADYTFHNDRGLIVGIQGLTALIMDML